MAHHGIESANHPGLWADVLCMGQCPGFEGNGEDQAVQIPDFEQFGQHTVKVRLGDVHGAQDRVDAALLQFPGDHLG